MAKIDKLNLAYFVILLIGFNLTISMEQESKSQESLDIFSGDCSYLEVNAENQKELLSARENCMPSLPDEIFYNIVKEVVKTHIDKWDNVFEFDAQFNKDEFNKDITNMFLICKRFMGYKADIVNIAKRLKIERFEYLKDQIKGQNNLSKKELNEKLLAMLTCNIPKERMKEIFKVILSGADVNTKNNNSYTALAFAALHGHKSIVELLINAGADINVQDRSGNTALMSAVINGYKNVVELLINAGVNINAQNGHGYTALMYAAECGYIDIVELLINSNADINLRCYIGDTNILMMALDGDHKDIIELLIRAGIDVNVQNRCGDTALMEAARNGNKDIVELFITAGANINLQNNNSETALMLAERFGHIAIVKLLESFDGPKELRLYNFLKSIIFNKNKH